MAAAQAQRAFPLRSISARNAALSGLSDWRGSATEYCRRFFNSAVRGGTILFDRGSLSRMIAHLRRVPYDGTPHGTPEPKKTEFVAD